MSLRDLIQEIRAVMGETKTLPNGKVDTCSDCDEPDEVTGAYATGGWWGIQLRDGTWYPNVSSLHGPVKGVAASKAYAVPASQFMMDMMKRDLERVMKKNPWLASNGQIAKLPPDAHKK